MNKLFFILSVGISAGILLSCGQGAEKAEKVNERTYDVRAEFYLFAAVKG